MDEQEKILNDFFETLDERLEDCSVEDTLTAFYKLMIKFQEQLNDEQELGVKIGNSPTGRLTRMEYYPPSLVVFYLNTGNGPVMVLQHHTQLNCSFVALPKANHQGPAVRLGFQVQEETEPERVSVECLPKKIS